MEYDKKMNAESVLQNETNLKKLLQKFTTTLLIMIDERSLLSSKQLAYINRICKGVMYGKRRPHKAFGGVLFFLLLGDDFQVPPIEHGPFSAFIKNPSNLSDMTKEGNELFLKFGKTTMHLSSQHRVQPDNREMIQILEKLRNETENSQLTQNQLKRILQLSLQHHRYSIQQIQAIKKESIHIFANKEPRDSFNRNKLQDLNSETNPVALIQSETCTLKENKQVQNNNHYDQDRNPSSTKLIKGAKVMICGYNFKPEWGLFHGSTGTLIEFYFEENTNPNYGQQPTAVIVDFPYYSGPIWDEENPTYVPIPCINVICDHNCCIRSYIPLKLSWARTGHTFQGFQVGPTPDGCPNNQFQKMIADPGTLQFEHQNIGFLYMLATRATTFGTEQDPMSSAIYFDGKNFDYDRITQLTIGKNGKELPSVHLRRKFVDYLKSNTTHSNISNDTKMKLFHWAQNTTYTKDQLRSIIKHI